MGGVLNDDVVDWRERRLCVVIEWSPDRNLQRHGLGRDVAT